MNLFYVIAAIAVLLYTVVWAIALLILVFNAADLASAATPWLEPICPRSPESPKNEN